MTSKHVHTTTTAAAAQAAANGSPGARKGLEAEVLLPSVHPATSGAVFVHAWSALHLLSQAVVRVSVFLTHVHGSDSTAEHLVDRNLSVNGLLDSEAFTRT